MALPEFAELPVQGDMKNIESPVVTLRIGKTVCEIYPGADVSVVSAALRAVAPKRC